MKLFSIFLLSISLAGCATMGGQELAQTKTLVISKCPVLKQYTKEELIKAATELEAVPSDSQLVAMITDYSKMRDACRAIVRKAKENRANN